MNQIERLIQQELNEELVEELNRLCKVADIVRRQRAKMDDGGGRLN